MRKHKNNHYKDGDYSVEIRGATIPSSWYYRWLSKGKKSWIIQLALKEYAERNGVDLYKL